MIMAIFGILIFSGIWVVGLFGLMDAFRTLRQYNNGDTALPQPHPLRPYIPGQNL